MNRFSTLIGSTKFKLAVLALLFGCLPLLQFSINRRRARIIPTGDVYLSLTPGEFAGTLMLGGFRGLAVDVLWIRAEQLKNEDRFFELVALSDMITKLQPHDRMVWEFNAWNRAYNISFEFSDPEEKWKWIKSGINLNLEGIRRMPENWKLKNHMAYMFMHKCSDFPVQTKRDFHEDNFTLARKYYRMALAQNPEAPLYVDRMVIHTYERQGDFETARELYRKHLETFPHDRTARKNLEDYILRKEQYDSFMKKALEKFAEKDHEAVVEIYQDNLTDNPYLMPAAVIEAVLHSYMETSDYDRAMDFIHRKMNLKMEDSAKTYKLYEEFTSRYNSHYQTEFENMQKKGENSRIIELYAEKIKKKSVEISIESGIIVLDSQLKSGRIDDARNLLIDLERQYPGDLRLVPFKGTLINKNR